jgi:hypothetical protein
MGLYLRDTIVFRVYSTIVVYCGHDFPPISHVIVYCVVIITGTGIPAGFAWV